MHIIDKRIKDLEPNGQIEYAKGKLPLHRFQKIVSLWYIETGKGRLKTNSTFVWLFYTKSSISGTNFMGVYTIYWPLYKHIFFIFCINSIVSWDYRAGNSVACKSWTFFLQNFVKEDTKKNQWWKKNILPSIDSCKKQFLFKSQPFFWVYLNAGFLCEVLQSTTPVNDKIYPVNLLEDKTSGLPCV